MSNEEKTITDMLRVTIESMRITNLALAAKANGLEFDNADQAKRIKELESALEFYADNFKYPWDWPADKTTEVIKDGGLIAKQALTH